MMVRRLESAEYTFVKTVFGLSAWRAIVVLSCVTLSATRRALRKVPVIIVIVGFGACLFCCCKCQAFIGVPRNVHRG